MKNRLVWVMILALLVSILPASAVAVPGSNPTQPALQDVMQDSGNGEFIVCIQKEGKWIEIGSQAYGSFVQEKEIEIGSLADLRGDIKIRIVSKGGGSAHLDSVLLDGKTPIAVNKGGPAALKKLSEMDFDLISIDNTGIELDFAESPHNGKLSIAGRIEGVEIGQIPFQFPLSNLYKQIDMKADFYTYDLNSSQGSLTVDGILETAESSKEFFKEYCRPGSGHPFGYIYGWVMNDSENLYVSLDVTPDNTIDGDKDYAKVYVKTDEGVKEFKVSQYETKWGSSAFTYTDKVVYEHKTYEFKIPFSEIGIEEAASDKEVSLAFAAYGTMSAPVDYDRPDAVYGDGNYLVVYEKKNYGSTKIFASFVNQEGIPENEFSITNEESGYQINPHVAYSNEENSYLVVWENENYDSGYWGCRIDGQRLDDHGEPLGNTIEVSVTSDVYLYQFKPDIAYSSADNQYLVVYESCDADDNYDIFGRFIDASDGEPIGDQFRLSDYEGSQFSPAVAYNQHTGEFLVTWNEYVSGDENVYGQFIKYSPENIFEKIGTKFTIGDLPGDDSDIQIDSAVTSDNDGNSFFVTWTDISYSDVNVYGCKVTNDNGTALVGHRELISDKVVYEYDLSGNANTAYGQNMFLTVWELEYGDPGEWICWRAVDADDGEVIGNAEILTGDEYLETNPTIAYNNDNPSFLVAYRGSIGYYYRASMDSEESPNFIGYKIIDFSDEKQIVGIEFDQEIYELDEGETLQTTVIAVYNDGSKKEITDQATFATSDTEGAYIRIGENTGIIEGLVPTSGITVEIIAHYLSFEAKANVIVNATEAEIDYNRPDAVYGDENYLVVYEKEDSKGSNIFGAFVDQEGKAGKEFPVAEEQAGYQYYPHVAYSTKENSYLVVWQGDSNERIYGQRLDDGGKPLGSTIQLSATSDEYLFQLRPDLAYSNADNLYLVVYESYNSNSRYNIYGRFINASNGEPLGDPFRLSDNEINKFYPAVAYNQHTGEFLVTWYANDFGDSNVYGQFIKYSPENTFEKIGTNFTIGDLPDNNSDIQTAPAVTSDSTGNSFFVTWTDNTFSTINVYGCKVTNDHGTALVGERELISDKVVSDYDQSSNPDTSYGQNMFLTVWEIKYGDPGVSIRWRPVDIVDGEVMGDAKMLTEDKYLEMDPTIAYNDDHPSFLVAYKGIPNDSPNFIGYKIIDFSDDKHIVGIEFDQELYSVQTGKSKQTYVMPVYSDGTVGETPISTGLTFSSDDPDKVTIDPTGKITGVSSGSNIIIRASYSEELEAYSALDDSEDGYPFTATAIVNVTAATAPSSSGGGGAPAVIGQILVDGKVIKNIYEKDVSLGEDTYTFTAAKAGDEARLWLLGSFFEKLGKDKKDPMLIFDWTDASYTLPFKCIDIKAVSDELKASTGSTKLNIIIQKAGEEENSKAEKTAEALGAEMVSGLMNFKVEVDAGSKGKKSIDSYNCYVSRTLKNVPDIDTLDTSGMKFLTDPDRFVFAPSIVEYDKDDGIMTIKYRGNGSYTILHYPRSFSDVSAHWGKRNIETLASRLIVVGREKDTFAPDNWITRGEFASMLVRALGITEEKGDVIFSDLAGRWYEDDVSAASNAGLVLGRGDGQFYPDDRILREEMAAMICRAISFTGADIEIEDADSVLARFRDHSAISDYAREYIAYCAQNGIILGRDTGDFAPLDNATRAEASAMVERMLKYIKFIN